MQPASRYKHGTRIPAAEQNSADISNSLQLNIVYVNFTFRVWPIVVTISLSFIKSDPYKHERLVSPSYFSQMTLPWTGIGGERLDGCRRFSNHTAGAVRPIPMRFHNYSVTNRIMDSQNVLASCSLSLSARPQNGQNCIRNDEQAIISPTSFASPS
jgi:hypothetical protein